MKLLWLLYLASTFPELNVTAAVIVFFLFFFVFFVFFFSLFWIYSQGFKLPKGWSLKVSGWA